MDIEHIYRMPAHRRTVRSELFSMRGRLGRRGFVGQTVLGFVVFGVLTLFVLFALMAVVPNPGQANQAALNVVAFPLVGFGVLFIVNQVSGMVRRLHDMGLSGWIGLVSLIPPVSVPFLVFLAFCPGIKGPNQYGQNPNDSASDIMGHGLGFEAKEKWKRAFLCYASIVEDTRFSELAKERALERIESLRQKLADRGIMQF